MPAFGSGMAVSFTARDSDRDGDTDLNWGLIVVNSALTGSGGCYVGYWRSSNSFFLLNDAGTAWLPTSVPAGSGGTVQNSQCILNGSGYSAIDAGNSLQVPVSLPLQSGLSGAN